MNRSNLGKNSDVLPGSQSRPVLIIGLDGATWTVLKPLIDAGKMPCLKRLMEQGASGVLHSTVPPITPAAWTTFLTGLQPGSHGIIDFERYDPLSNRLMFNSTRCLDHVRNLWQIVGGHGLKVGSVNVPMTYPPLPVNGFMVSGFETPGPKSEFAYPAGLKPEILSRWPDPTLRAKWRHSTLFPRRTFNQNLDYISRSFVQGAEMTMWLGDRHGWDALMVVFKLTDNLQHKTWKYLDARWADRTPARRAAAERCFTHADQAVEQLCKYTQARDANILIVSDHGHGSLEGKVQPNLLLQKWGYLCLSGVAAQKSTRLKYLLDRLRGRTARFTRHGDIAQDLAVDFSRTRAAIMHAGMAGFLYINLRGRQPQGIVPQKEYESLRDELIERFRGPDCLMVGPHGETINLFSAVHKPEELYGCSREEQPWMPDLIIIPHETLAVVRRVKGNRVVRWLPYSRIEGTHRPEGIFLAAGPDIAHAANVSAHLADCAPTILTLMGLPVPQNMQGRVLSEIFGRTPNVLRESGAHATTRQAADCGEIVYSAQDLEQVTARLTNLGYLE